MTYVSLYYSFFKCVDTKLKLKFSSIYTNKYNKEYNVFGLYFLENHKNKNKYRLNNNTSTFANNLREKITSLQRILNIYITPTRV